MDVLNPMGRLAQLDMTPLLQGFQIRRENKARQASQELAQRKFEVEQTKEQVAADRKAAFLEDWGKVSGSPSQAGYRFLNGKYPDYMEPIEKGWKTYSEGEQSAMADTAGAVISSINSGRPDFGLQAIDRRIEALKSAGVDTTQTQAMRDLMAAGDPGSMAKARGIATMIMSTHSGDKFDQVYRALNGEQRDNELQPDKLREARAGADLAETKARFAPAIAAADVAGKEARTGNTLSLAARRAARSNAGSAGSSTDTSNPKPPRAGRAAAKPVLIKGPGGKVLKLQGGKWVPAN